MRLRSAIVLLALIRPAYADPPPAAPPSITFAVENDPALPAGLFIGGQRVRELTVYRTGVIVFDGAEFDPMPRPLGELVMGRAIAVFWAPLEPRDCPGQEGPSALRRVDLPDGLRFEWSDMPVAGCPGGMATFAAELRLDEDGALVRVELSYAALPRETLPIEPRAGLNLDRVGGNTTLELFPDPEGGVLRGRAKWLAEGSSDGDPGVWTIALSPEGQIEGEREPARIINPVTGERDRPDGWRASDNCPDHFNPLQEDMDADGLGDPCDRDADGDLIDFPPDNCELVVNPDQADLDDDGLGDACDPDVDGDGWPDELDRCPRVHETGNRDIDGDGIGDACDPDADSDDLWARAFQRNRRDLCPLVFDPMRIDRDYDGLGDACDLRPDVRCVRDCVQQSDQDGDGVHDGIDLCPTIYDPRQGDLDGDGLGDMCDADTNGDGRLDAYQLCERSACDDLPPPVILPLSPMGWP